MVTKLPVFSFLLPLELDLDIISDLHRLLILPDFLGQSTLFKLPETEDTLVIIWQDLCLNLSSSVSTNMNNV